MKNEFGLSSELAGYLKLYPENKRRPVNKTIFRNEYFQLTYSMKEKSMSISSRGDIVYSAIPYDTGRNYIQRAAIQYLIHPESVHQYIKLHKADIEKYLILSIAQAANKKVKKNSRDVTLAYQAIFENPLFEIQVLGRLMQHDETGPLSANLAGKFLYSENVKTGISEYVSEYLAFVVELTNRLPLATDGRNVQLIKSNQQKRLSVENNADNSLTSESDIKPALKLLPGEVKQSVENALVIQEKPVNKRPILKSEHGKELAAVRKNYKAHSIHPKILEPYFDNVLPTENANTVNVISDVHAMEGNLPFSNQYFNILAGDISDSKAASEDIRGIYVIGNHELSDVLPDVQSKEDGQWKKWKRFFRYEWFKRLIENPDDAWYLLPVGTHIFYKVVRNEINKRFPGVDVLNNSSIMHDGVRYIGLTIPVALVERKKEQQEFIHNVLERLLKENYQVPTVIISHAPLFNELSMLRQTSRAYSPNYTCSEPRIEKLFHQYNIIGAIHGHHHIPASSGQYKIVEFAGKELFVVCSVYSRINTGFDLMKLIYRMNQ